jgi:translation elongation factor aEF-1 beta
MAKIVATMKVMPTGTDVSLEGLGENVENVIIKHGRVYKKKIQPIAFGINALVYEVLMEEKAGGTDAMEAEVKDVPEVSDVQVTDVTRIMDVNF